VLSLAVAGALLAGCGTAAATPGPTAGRALRVVVGVYPYQWVAERVGGADVRVRNLARPGAEPHDIELTARQVGAVEQADLVVTTHGFQPAVDDAVAQEARGRDLDVLGVVPARRGTDENGDVGVDPHLWLDPTRLAAVGDAVAERLARLAPERAAAFRERAGALHTDLDALDRALRSGLASCERTDVVTSHAAYGYLAERYGLRQVAISGLSPDAEPSAARLADVARLARARGVTTVFFEQLVSPRVAEQLAREVGARAEVLDPLETAPAHGGDYLSALRADLTTLRTALRCS
jgi:zinc transport system substrate-binding protein